MENETAKGLHFPASEYAPIRRTSWVTAQSEGLTASDGEKALKSLDAHGITARFNPWGVFVRQWRFSDVHVESGEVAIQIYQANPEAVKPKPWFSIFLPNRVFLKHVESEHSDITWQFRGELAGFFGTQLLITPHGSDFEYFATGGRLPFLTWSMMAKAFGRRLGSDGSSGTSTTSRKGNAVPTLRGMLLNCVSYVRE